MKSIARSACPFLLFVLPVFASPHPPSQQEEASLEELAETIKGGADDTDPDLIRKLANLKSRAALDALVEIYPVMLSAYMRREMLKAFALFDGEDTTAQTAAEMIANAATDSKERDLRLYAVELLAGFQNFGRPFLKFIVDSAADDEVRTHAMRFHIRDPRSEDRAWYLELFQPPTRDEIRDAKKDRKRAERRGDEEAEEAAKIPFPLESLRELAFEALVSDMDLERVLEATNDGNRKIKVRALEELEVRGSSDKAVDVAESLYGNGRAAAADRLVAAKVLYGIRGKSILEEFFKDMTRANVPEGLAVGLADMISEANFDETNKLVASKVGKSKEFDKVLMLRAGKHLDDKKYTKALERALKDKDDRVNVAAMRIIAERGDKEAAPELEKILEKSKDRQIISAAVETLSALYRSDADWEARLANYAKSEDPNVRNAAIRVLGDTRNPDYLPLLGEAIRSADWSTRLAAAYGLETIKRPEGVGFIAERIAEETGRVALEMGQILFRLTGKPYRDKGRLWKLWWENEGSKGFEFLTEAELRKLRREEEVRELREMSTTEFFGLRIESTRVIFILDVSGSMDFLTRGEFLGEKGVPRIDPARRELDRCLAGLGKDAFFNMIFFSDQVTPWQDQVAQVTPEAIADAKEFLERVRPLGGTNVYGALERAFEDPEVDTIFLLSDGEPSVGAVIDPFGIRSEVADWNRNRGVIINSIAVGAELDLLRWLAEDTGGTYVEFN